MKKTLVALLALSLQLPAWGGDVTIEEPKGGWRQGETGERYTQEVNYPASVVNTPKSIATTALIKGRIEGARKGGDKAEHQRPAPDKPATLIVNGTAMPLRIEADGSFSRPYAFGQGSNSVEVRMPDNGPRQRVQFYDTAAGKAQSRLRVVLSWDSDGTDLDLHVITPSGEHAWYGQRVIAGGGALDVDVTTGYGPEIFSHPAPERGVYLVYVNYYGSGSAAGDLTIAQIAVISNENTPNEKRQVFQVPMRRAGDLTLVCSFVYP
jgi:uncharacterized protein YfaP (DUF2135 family)